MDLHYCEIPVKVKRFGITRTRQQGFLFSNLCWYLIYDEYGWDFDLIPQVKPEELMSKMVYQAARVANWDKGLPAKFTIKEMAEWLDKCETVHTKRLQVVYQNAMMVLSEDLISKVGSIKKK
jgi:hypothetical protein